MQSKTHGFLVALGIFGVLLLAPWQAEAGTVEFSLGFSFNRTNYSDTSYSWTRRWGTSLGYYISDKGEIELAFQDVLDRTKVTGYEDTTFHDRIYSVNWVQSFTGRNTAIQPYVKAGAGQLNRDSTGLYANGASPPTAVDSFTVVLGAGLRIYITRSFAIRSEATSYVAGANIQKWKDNVAVTVGTSIFF